MNLSDMIENQRNYKSCDFENDQNTFKTENRSTSSKSNDKNTRKRSRSSRKSQSIRKRSTSQKKDKSKSDRYKSRSSSRSHKRKSNSRHREKRYRDDSRNRDRRTRDDSRSRVRRSRDDSRSRDRRPKDDSSYRSRRNRDEESPRRKRSDSRSRCYAADVKEIQKKFTDDEKDARTIYVWQLNQRVRTKELEDLFSTIGKLCVVRLILDPRSGKSKGVAYIQFRNVESVDRALGLNGTKLLGFPIMVRTVSSEKCRAAEASMIGGGINMKGPTKLCISNLHQVITEKNLDELFSPYGTINEIQLLKDINGKSSGTAFITFHKGENAKVAMDSLNEFLLGHMHMKITPVAESNFGSELNESMGVSMSSSARLGLMAKLAVGTGLQMTPAVQYVESSLISTQCFVFSNMFDLDEAADEEFCKEIEEDVITECSKFGGILHIHVDRKGPSGNVYIKCQNVPVASQCVNSMNGRSFGGRTISATHIPLTNYSDMFPESVKSTKILKF